MAELDIKMRYIEIGHRAVKGRLIEHKAVEDLYMYA